MKMIEKIIKDIPMLDIEKEDSEYHDECKYLIDTKILLKELQDFEVDIPNEYIENYENVYGNGVLQYMADITKTNIEDFKGDNTYNHGTRVLHDFTYRYVDLKDSFYIAISVHRQGDIRGNYTDFCLLKFNNYEEYCETLDQICIENFSGCVEYDNKHYFYDILLYSEYLRVWCEEDQRDYEIYAYNNESFINEIKRIEEN